MPAGSVLTATNRSLKAAGVLEEPKYAGLIAVLRVVAPRLDQLDAGAKEDNTVLAAYFKYSEALGLTPPQGQEPGRPASEDQHSCHFRAGCPCESGRATGRCCSPQVFLASGSQSRASSLRLCGR